MNGLNMRAIGRAAAGLFFVFVLPTLAHAQSNLVLPRGASDFRELTRTPPGQPCQLCGVVTDVRSATQEVRSVRVGEVADEQVSQLVSSPLISANRSGIGRAAGPETMTRYTVTVRYENGAYASFEQDDAPAVKKGDRIEVRDGRVQRR